MANKKEQAGKREHTIRIIITGDMVQDVALFHEGSKLAPDILDKVVGLLKEDTSYFWAGINEAIDAVLSADGGSA